MIPYFMVIGYSDSGKTTVVRELVRIFKGRGLRVAAVKHAAHGYDLEPPGKDSWNYAQAGADKTIVAGPDSVTTHEFFTESPSLDNVLAGINNVDLIIVEGFKTEKGPKIEVFRQGFSSSRIKTDSELLALVTDDPNSSEVVSFKPDQIEALADFLLQQMVI
ncbi:MAG: molybdopterin-guanine dinucleotide biosynthesis protein B [Chitinophagales bacterium]